MNENNKVVQEKEALLIIESLGHAALVFVNKRLVGGNSNRCKETLFSFFMCYFFFPMVAKSLLLVIHLKVKLILLQVFSQLRLLAGFCFTWRSN